MPRKKRERCYGFDSGDGQYIYCTREDYGGRDCGDGRYLHMADGPCECGRIHGALTRPGRPASSVAPRNKRPGRVLPFRAPSSTPSTPDPAPSSTDTPRDAGEWIVLWKQSQGEWLYRDAAGVPVYKVTRYPMVNTITGERDKTYLPSHPPRTGRGRWPKGLDGVTCIPYRLPELLAADPLATVYLTEGEKCADALAAAGLLATATQGGAQSWHKTAPAAVEALRGRHVVILPDRDAPGARYALDAAASLHGLAASVRVVELPDLTEPGADVFDWLDAGGTAGRLAQLAAAAPVWAPSPDPVEAAMPAPLSSMGRGPGRPGGPDMPPPAPLPALVELHPIRGLWCDRERTQLYRVSRSTGRTSGRGKGDPGEDDPGEDDGPTLEPMRLLAGMPRLLSVSTVGGESDGDPSEQTVWRWEWSNLPQYGPITATEKELNAGAVHAKTPGVAITARADRDTWADVIKAQVIAFGIPVGVARQYTGWQQDEKTGLWERHMRDGRVVQRPDAAPVSIAGLRFGGAHRDAWESDMPDLPAQAPTPDQLRELLAFVERVDPLGRLLAQMGAAARASVATFVPTSTVVLPTGQNRAGKTISSNFARGFDGPCPPRARADCVFTGTIPGLAAALTPLHDEYLLVDDFHVKDTDGPSEIAKLGNQLDMLITGGADGNDMRPRATQTGKRRQEMIVTGMLCLTGEGLPATTESRFLRSTFLPYKRGEMDTAELLAHWTEYQRIWWMAGHAAFRWEGERVNDDLPTFRREAEQREATYKARMLAQLRAECTAMDVEALDTLASNYARPALGLWLVDRACGTDTDTDAGGELGEDGVMVAAVWPHLARLAVMQARAVELGGPGQASREWILSAVRGLVAEGRAHGLDTLNKPLEDGRVPGALSDWGYQGTWPRGEHLFNYDADTGLTYWRTERLCAALADRAGRARPQPVPWKWGAETLPAYLVRLGIAIPETDAQGNVRRNVQRPYIAGERTRRIAILAELFVGEAVEDNDPGEDDPITSPIEKGDPSGPSGPSGPIVPPSLKISDAAYGTAWDRSPNASGPNGSTPAGNYYADGGAADTLDADDTGWPDDSAAPDTEQLDALDAREEPAPAPVLSDRAREIAERARRAGADAWTADRHRGEDELL